MRHLTRSVASRLSVSWRLASAGRSRRTRRMKRWVQGKGWGWVWGPTDEVGSLNEMTDASRLAALRLVTTGKAYDLGLPYDRSSFKWVGHSAGEIVSFPDACGERSMQDLPFTTPAGGNTGGTGWHSNIIFMNDNVATQIDGLAHITHGADSHFYNGFLVRRVGRVTSASARPT